jgi:hypothetical protein
LLTLLLEPLELVHEILYLAVGGVQFGTSLRYGDGVVEIGHGLFDIPPKVGSTKPPFGMNFQFGI